MQMEVCARCLERVEPASDSGDAVALKTIEADGSICALCEGILQVSRGEEGDKAVLSSESARVCVCVCVCVYVCVCEAKEKRVTMVKSGEKRLDLLHGRFAEGGGPSEAPS